MAKHTLISISIILSISFTSFALDWWEDASIYQIYPRSFKDSDGDGIGDLKGIIQNLDYLKDIRITAAWLSPIFKSPMVDNGYDISNYTDIDPIFGNLDDFDALIKKAKDIGLKIILDFVPNHTSNESEWFQNSINRKDGYDEFYVWLDGKDDPENPGKKLPPNNWMSELGGSMWTYNEIRQQFYLHQFLEQQPDLNYRNPEVHDKMLDVLNFWLDRGVDGFRVDATNYIYEKRNDDGTYPDQDPSVTTNTREQPETVNLVMEWRACMDDYQNENGGDTRALYLEAYSPISFLSDTCGNETNKGAHSPFNFNLINLDNSSNARDVQEQVDNWIEVMYKDHKIVNWVTGNHDKDRVYNRIGENKTDLALMLLLMLPGTSTTFYGEEIAMSNVVTCHDCSASEARNVARSPFQWNNGTSAGFSSSNNTWLPVSKHYKKVNVKSELAAPKSSLKLFIDLQELRTTAAFKAFKDPNGFNYRAVNDNVFIVDRRSENEEYVICVNWGNNEEKIGALLSSTDIRSNNFEYTVVGQNSLHKIGENVTRSDIKLDPLEGFVLKAV